ncbi:MAG: hypothetical protein ACO1QB_08245, partial [Verrucomicrobiales bacterium]
MVQRAINLAVVGIVSGTTFVACAASKKPAISTTTHFGMCDASAGVFISPQLFVAADDEQNVLNVYGTDSTTPVKAISLQKFLISGA